MAGFKPDGKNIIVIMKKQVAMQKTWHITIQTRKGLLTSGSTPMAIVQTWKVTTIDAQLQ